MAERREPLKLNDDNWLEWRAEIRGKLYLEKVQKAINKPVPPVEGAATDTRTQAQIAEAKAKEVESDELAKVIIEMNLSQDYLRKCEHCTTAWQLWELLTEHFEAQNKNSVPTNVERLANLIKDPPDPEKIVLEVRGVAAKLNEVQVNSTEFLIPLFACMLPSDYNDLRSAINNKKVLTLTDADNLIKMEAKRKEKKPIIAAQKTKQNKQKKQCTFCNKKGHLVEDCWAKQKTEKADDESKTVEKPKEKTKLTAIRNRVCKLSEKKINWFLDSGAGTHSVCKPDGFTDFDKSRKTVLESASGQDIEVKGVGTYEIRTRGDMKLLLQDCHYAPELIGNFMSASKINKYGMDIMLRRDGTVLVLDDDGIVAQGHEENGMYKMCVDDEAVHVSNNKIAALRPSQRSFLDWHRALGHLNFEDMSKLGIKMSIYRSIDRPLECKTCLMGKFTRKPFDRLEITTVRPLELIHTDLSGTIRVPAVDGVKYYLTFVDDYSRFTSVYLLKSKEHVFERFVEFKNLVENKFDSKIKSLKSDNGTEYTNHKFQDVIKESGIEHDFSQVRTPQQNGVAERINRTIKNGARCALLDSGLPARFWPFAVKYTIQTRNACPNSAIGYETPYERWNGKEANIEKFYPFGSAAIIHNQNPKNDFDARGIECRMLQLCDNKHGYLLVDMKNQRFHESRDVKFLHEQPPNELSNNSNCIQEIQTLFDDFCPEDESASDENGPPTMQTENESTTDAQGEISTHSMTGGGDGEQLQQTFMADAPSTEAILPETQADQNEVPAAEREIVEEHVDENGIIRLTDRQLADYMLRHPDRRLQALPMKATKKKGGAGRPPKEKAYKLAYVNPLDEIAEKIESPEGEHWKNAMDDEFESLVSKNTWTLTKPPKGAKIIKTRWVFAKKDEPSGTRYKARLVAKGFTQRPGIDYLETFAPVMRKSSIRLLLAFACRNNFLIHHVDVKTAYLNADLAEEVYIDQPIGYEAKTDERLVCRLNKAIYGLKQSAKCWNEKLNEIMSQIGLKPFASEECIFANKNNELMVGAYVDDLLIISASIEMIENFKRRLSDHLQITDKGELQEFLGIAVRKTEDSLVLSQEKLIDDLLDKNNFLDCNGIKTPMSTTVDLNESSQSTATQVCLFQSIVGSLMYIASSTRPDIQYSTSKLAQYMSAPTQMHLNAAKRVLRYLKETKSVGLVYKNNHNDNLEIHADADFANGDDSRSISGVAVFFGGNLIEWSSTKQQLVALATCESEINSIKDAACDAIYFRELLNEIDTPGHPQPVVIYNDNLPGKDILEGGGKFKRTKHYKIRLNFLKQLMALQMIEIEHIPTTKMIADAFTKALPEQQHNILMSKAGMTGL